MSNGMRDLTVEELDMVTGGIIEMPFGPVVFQFGGKPGDERWTMWHGGDVAGQSEEEEPGLGHEPWHVPGPARPAGNASPQP